MFPDVDLAIPADPTNDVEEFTESQKKIADKWAELLGTSKFGPYDNFFDLGGNSLSFT